MESSAKGQIKNPKLGVIIPIYNASFYLRECLESVRNQTYRNLAILLVDDGSTDGSLEIAKEYVNIDSRFTLICKENGGQSTARNVGIAWFSYKYEIELGEAELPIESYKLINDDPYGIHAIYAKTANLKPEKIDYLAFLDSDDYWLPNFAMECLKEANGASVVWCDYFFHIDGVDREEEEKECKSIQKLYFFSNKLVVNKEEWLDLHISSGLYTFPWTVLGIIDFNFLISKKLAFLDYAMYEDHLFGIQVFMQADFICILPRSLYCYRCRPNSTCDFDKSHSVAPYFKKNLKLLSNDREIKEYHGASCWLLIFLELLDFMQNLPGDYAKKAANHILPAYADAASSMLDCKKDPLGLSAKLYKIEPYLYDKKRAKLIKSKIDRPTIYPIVYTLYIIYGHMKCVERFFRKKIVPLVYETLRVFKRFVKEKLNKSSKIKKV